MVLSQAGNSRNGFSWTVFRRRDRLRSWLCPSSPGLPITRTRHRRLQCTQRRTGAEGSGTHSRQLDLQRRAARHRPARRAQPQAACPVSHFGCTPKIEKTTSAEQVRLDDFKITSVFCRTFYPILRVSADDSEAGKATRFPDPWLRRIYIRFVALSLTALLPQDLRRADPGACANGLPDRTQGPDSLHQCVFGKRQGKKTQNRHREPSGVCRDHAPRLEGRVPNLLGTPLRGSAAAPCSESTCRSRSEQAPQCKGQAAP